MIRTLVSCSTSGTSTGVADRNLPMTAMVGPSMSGVKPYCRKEHCKFVGEEFKTTTATSQNALSSDEDYELHVDVSGEAVRIGKENGLVSQMIHKMSTVILLRKGKNACWSIAPSNKHGKQKLNSMDITLRLRVK